MTLKQFREEKGISQTQLAEKVGVKQTTISQYEKGSRKPDLARAKKLSDALGISLDDFFVFLHFKMKYRKIILKRGEKENVKYYSKNKLQRLLSGPLHCFSTQ